jgi:hypothetical protein
VGNEGHCGHVVSGSRTQNSCPVDHLHQLEDRVELLRSVDGWSSYDRIWFPGSYLLPEI